MAQFDESKVINAFHADKAEVGKKYWYSDNLLKLKRYVEENSADVGELSKVEKNKHDCVFHFVCGSVWQFIYPYEEPPKQRMTIRQFAEWLMKGNGEYTLENYESTYATYSYRKCVENYEVESGVRIRTWDSEEWIEPTVDIYKRDCKGGKE